MQRETTIKEAITVMIKPNYLQLPILSPNLRTCDGIINWKSIGNKLYFQGAEDKIYNCREQVDILNLGIPLLNAVTKVLG